MTAPKTEWQDISTAPKDGTEVLVCGSKRLPYAVAHYDRRDGLWYLETCSDTVSIYSPTHWQPLPPLPEPPAEASRHDDDFMDAWGRFR